MRTLTAALALVLAASSARADSSDRSDGARVWHAVPFVAGGGVYLVLELGLKDAVTPDHCRWCESNALDTEVRRRYVWRDPRLADRFSNLTGYVGAPAVALGLLGLSSVSRDGDGRKLYDDLVPVLQAGIATGVVNQLTKLVFVRRRPYANFGGVSTRAANDANTSFFSGHTALAFAMASSSATVAHLRGYRSEAALWVGGLGLATLTGYYRIAADAHYFTDVAGGAIVGAAIGVAVPLLFHRDVLEDEPGERSVIVPIGAGRF